MQLCTAFKNQVFSKHKNCYQQNTKKLGNRPTELKGKQEFLITDLESEPCNPPSQFSMPGRGIEDRWRKQTTARFLNYAARPVRSMCKMQILSNKH